VTKSLLIVAMVSLLAGCANSPSDGKPVPAEPAPPLLGTYWKLLTIAGNPVIHEDQLREPSLIIHEQDNRFNTTAGVNLISGGWKMAGDKLTFSPGPSTLMAGPEPLMQQEQHLSQSLGKVTRYVIEGRTLTLYAGDEAVITATVAPQP
jgi:heat shock protein HslJ